MINYLDLFSGCGGFRYGLQQAGVSIDHEYHSDIDKYANETYARHFKGSTALGNIQTIKPIDGKINGHKINLITFGFPCQDLSIAGKGAGLEGSRSGLFYEATRLIRELKPEIFIFENVKGLLSHSEGRAFTEVLRTIADIGLYDCEWQLLNTRWFLPQNRERVYFIGRFRAKSNAPIFPIIGPGKKPNKAQQKARGKRQWVSSTLYTKADRGDGTYIIESGRCRTFTDVECCRLHGFPDDWVSHLSYNQAMKQMGNTVSPAVTTEIFKRLYKDK